MNDILNIYDRIEFLKNSGWGNAQEISIGEDWSQRKIFRIKHGKRTAVLMHAVPDHDPRATPGHALRDFVNVSEYLRHIECSSPNIYTQDLSKGLLLVEDFGDDLFVNLFERQPNIKPDLYSLATRTLIHLYKKTEFVAIDIPDYFKSHIHKGRIRVVDWYIPAILNRPNYDDMGQEFLTISSKIEKSLPPVRRRFLHADFHPGNLMWLPERNDIKQAGLIDFQGALMGPAPYDLVNLLDDARRIVPDDIRTACLNKFTNELSGEEKESFDAWYRVLACHFHCRVIGQAIKLSLRFNKTRLMNLIPTLRHHLRRDLEHPVLAPLKQWFDDVGINFTEDNEINLLDVSKFIHHDAF